MRCDRLDPAEAIAADDASSSPGYVEQAVTRYKHQGTGGFTASKDDDAIAVETPIALSYNGIAHAVMMATPLNLEDFALGFSLSEGIVDAPEQIYGMECQPTDAGIELRLEIASVCFNRLKEKRRNLTGRTGCGICGSESLAMLDFSAPSIAPALPAPLAPAALLKACAALEQQQEINRHTGAVHAAAWADMDGALLCVREDLGRHNALDKLIGALAQQRQTRTPGFALLTSRASYELVQKAARARLPLLAAISAPTSLAIQIAAQAGLTLVGFTREDGFVVYAGAAGIAVPG